MNEYMRVDAMRDRWLEPPAYPERRNRHRCTVCMERTPDIPYFRLKTGVVCDECRSDFQLPFDTFPEEEDAKHACCVCGEICKNEVTLIGADAYCSDCIEEAKIYDYEN